MPRPRKKSKGTPSKKEATVPAEDDNVPAEEPEESATSTTHEADKPQQESDENMISDPQTTAATDVDLTEDEPAAATIPNKDEEGAAENENPVEEMETAEDDKQVDASLAHGMDEDESVIAEENNTEKKEATAEETASNKQNKRKPVTLYRPQTIPNFCNSSLIEKWEWHLKFFPIDQADIRSCVLETVSKIAQETWMYVDKSNYGMGTYELCVKTPNDAAMIMLKTLSLPMTYRYLTVEITKRGQNEEEREKMSKGKELDEESDGDESDNLPYKEVVEKATLLLDFLYTPGIEKVKGKSP